MEPKAGLHYSSHRHYLSQNHASLETRSLVNPTGEKRNAERARILDHQLGYRYFGTWKVAVLAEVAFGHDQAWSGEQDAVAGAIVLGDVPDVPAERTSRVSTASSADLAYMLVALEAIVGGGAEGDVADVAAAVARGVGVAGDLETLILAACVAMIV